MGACRERSALQRQAGEMSQNQEGPWENWSGRGKGGTKGTRERCRVDPEQVGTRNQVKEPNKQTPGTT